MTPPETDPESNYNSSQGKNKVPFRAIWSFYFRKSIAQGTNKYIITFYRHVVPFADCDTRGKVKGAYGMDTHAILHLLLEKQ
jgi:hypothetical protein